MACDLLKRVCSRHGDSIHLVFYIHLFIKKTPRRENCVAHTLPLHLSLLEFASFMMNEWNKKKYGSILQIKTVFVSHSGKCFEYKVNSHNNILETKELIYLNTRRHTLLSHYYRLPCKICDWECSSSIYEHL